MTWGGSDRPQQPRAKPQGRGRSGEMGREPTGCWSLESCWRKVHRRGRDHPSEESQHGAAARPGWARGRDIRAPSSSPTACPCPLPSQHLQQHESGVEGESCYYHCVLCNYSTKAKLNLIQHVRSMKHQRSESLRKLQRLQKGLPEEDEDLGQIFTIRRCPSTEPGEWSRSRVWTSGGGGGGALLVGCWFWCPSLTSSRPLCSGGNIACVLAFFFFFKLKELSTTFLWVSRAAAQ